MDLISRCEFFQSRWPTGELGFLLWDSLNRPRLAMRPTVSLEGLLHLPPSAKLAPLQLHHSYFTRTTHAPPVSFPPNQSFIQIAAMSSNPPCNEGSYLQENNLRPESIFDTSNHSPLYASGFLGALCVYGLIQLQKPFNFLDGGQPTRFLLENCPVAT